MEYACFFCFVMGAVVMAWMIVLAARQGRAHATRKVDAFEAFRAFAEGLKAEPTDTTLWGVGKVNEQVEYEVQGYRCRVWVGYSAGELELTLGVEAPELGLSDFEDCWERCWTRYLKRDYDERITVMGSSEGVSLTGPGHSLRDVFAEVGGEAMARLFDAPRKGRGGKQVTTISHLGLSEDAMSAWCANLRKHLGCGGSVEGDQGTTPRRSRSRSTC